MSKLSRFTLNTKSENPINFTVESKKVKELETALADKRIAYTVTPVKTRKTLKIIALVLVLVFVGAAVFAGITLFKKSDGAADLGIANNRFVGLGLPPTSAKDLPLYDLPDETDDLGHKQLAYELYNKANQLDLAMDKRMILNSCPTLNYAAGMANYIDLDIVEIKNGNQYFRCDYRLKNRIPLFDSPMFSAAEKQLNELLELVLSERRYYNTDMSVMKSQKVKNAYVGEGIPFARWGNNPVEIDMEPPIFRVEQGKEFEKFEHKLTVDTIKTAKVTYDAEHKYYEVELVMDVENPLTTAKKLPEVKKGTGDDNAKFVRLDVSFQVFTSGYFRKFSYFEIWEARVVLGLAVRGEFDNNEVFSYSAVDCDIDNYNDSKQYKAYLGI